MARKRTAHGPDVDARIAGMTARGWTAERIEGALKRAGVDMSRATIGRRMRELRGKTRVGRTAKKASASRAPKKKPTPSSSSGPTSLVEGQGFRFVDEPPLFDAEALAELKEIDLPKSGDAIPEGLSVDMLVRLRRKAEFASTVAMEKGELATFAAMGRLVTALSEAIRKATPPEKPNPEDAPDMIAAATRARERLHAMVEKVLRDE